MPHRARWLIALAAVAGTQPAIAADDHRSHFASIHLDGGKIGNVHYTVKYDDQGEIEELKTRASVSLLGFEVFHFTQHLHESWEGGELQRLRGHTDDDGAIFESSAERTPAEYNAALNGEPLVLPHEAFPMSLWHYRITEQSLLFDLKDLRLLQVEVAKSEDTVSIDGRSVPAFSFAFSGDWQGTVWFDRDEIFLRAEYEVEGRGVVVSVDP
jgi:hypothetical protein